MDSGEQSIFFAELDDQLKQIEIVIGKIEDRREGFAEDIRLAESLAYQFHNSYCAIEDLFKIVARFFENHIKSIAGNHIELLNRMTLEIEGVRPALISKEMSFLINEFRAFRHAFRHAYAYDIDVDKIRLLFMKFEGFKAGYKRDIAAFKKGLLSSGNERK